MTSDRVAESGARASRGRRAKLIFWRTVQNEVRRFLSLSRGDHDKPLLATDFLEPALNVRRFVLDNGRRDSGFRTKIGG